jgi:hypothetical protein
MPILIVLELIIIITLVLLFIVGPIVMIIGKVKQNKNVLRIGFKLFLIPILVCSSVLIYYLALDKFGVKPTKIDLVGNYKLTSSCASRFGDANLRLYENGNFEKSFMSNHGLCEKGKYNLYDNEVWFRCDNRSSVAKIDRGFTDFKIKFIIGNNPNSDEIIIFEKVDD